MQYKEKKPAMKYRVNSPEWEALLKRLQNNDPTLTSLDLCDSEIGDPDVIELAKVLAQNKTIRNLDISRNNISDAGAAEFAKVLLQNQTITNLDLGGNKIGDIGGMKLVQALSQNKTITYLALYNNKITNSGVTELTNILSENKMKITRLILNDGILEEVNLNLDAVNENNNQNEKQEAVQQIQEPVQKKQQRVRNINPNLKKDMTVNNDLDYVLRYRLVQAEWDKQSQSILQPSKESVSEKQVEQQTRLQNRPN